MEEPEVRDMVAVKYPARKLELPATLSMNSPIDNLGELRESLLGLKNGISTGSGGLRPEFLKTLAWPGLAWPFPSRASTLGSLL